MSHGYDAVAPTVEPLDGWMSSDQGRRLFDAGRRCPPGGRVVEIGSFRGKSTIVLASAVTSDVEVVAIDPHAGNDRGPQEIEGYRDEAADDHRAFEGNLTAARVRDRVRHVREFSDRAHDQVADPIDVLYVDGAHRFGPARADLRDWGARVVPGGTMLVHDAFSSIGVTAALFREVVASSRWRYVGRSRSLVEYRADLEPGVGARLRNVVRQAAVLPWFVRNVTLKFLLTVGLGRVLTRFGRTAPEWPY